jgi:hypothetical protein
MRTLNRLGREIYDDSIDSSVYKGGIKSGSMKLLNPNNPYVGERIKRLLNNVYVGDQASRYKNFIANAQTDQTNQEYEDPLKPLSDIGGIVGRLILSKITGKIKKAIPQDGIHYDLLRSFLDSVENGSYADAHVLFGKSFPWAASRYAFTQGASTTEMYYTVQWKQNGKTRETALYIKPKYEEDPIEFLKQNGKLDEEVKKVIQNPSRVDMTNKSKLKYNQVKWTFTKGDMTYYHGDLRGLEEFRRFYDTLKRLDLFDIQQLGPREVYHNIGDISPQIKEVKVIRYRRPPWYITYLSNELGNLEYDLWDILTWNTFGKHLDEATTALLYVDLENKTLARHRMNERRKISGREPPEHLT